MVLRKGTLWLVTFSLVLVAMSVAGHVCAFGAESADGKKIIGFAGPPHLGGIGRTPLAMTKTGAGVVDALPIDGVIHTMSDNGNELITNRYMNAGAPVTYDMQRSDVAAMTDMGLKRVTENFYRINVAADLTANWFDDKAWERILSNIKSASRAACDARSAGFMLDTEQYNVNKPFSYMLQPDRMEKSWDEYRAQVRRRGRQFMEALSSSCPGPRVLITFSNSYVVDDKAPAHIMSMGLWPAFLDGMMDADVVAEFIDGYEQSYTYR
ncbi:MAG: hypothetical protein PHT33_13925, partial [bacterium]|nr:hypothetical protein [bacterium]